MLSTCERIVILREKWDLLIRRTISSKFSNAVGLWISSRKTLLSSGYFMRTGGVWHEAPRNQQNTVNTKHCQVEMKTDPATSWLISRLKCPQKRSLLGCVLLLLFKRAATLVQKCQSSSPRVAFIQLGAARTFFRDLRMLPVLLTYFYLQQFPCGHVPWLHRHPLRLQTWKLAHKYVKWTSYENRICSLHWVVCRNSKCQLLSGHIFYKLWRNPLVYKRRAGKEKYKSLFKTGLEDLEMAGRRGEGYPGGRAGQRISQVCELMAGLADWRGSLRWLVVLKTGRTSIFGKAQRHAGRQANN